MGLFYWGKGWVLGIFFVDGDRWLVGEEGKKMIMMEEEYQDGER